MNLPIYFFSIFFGSAYTGLIGLALERLALTAPGTLALNSIGLMFKASAANELHSTGRISQSIQKSLFFSLVPASITLLFLWLTSEDTWSAIFGTKWSTIGEILLPFCVIAAIRVIYLPLTFVFVLRKKLKLNFILQLIYVAIMLICMCVTTFLLNWPAKKVLTTAMT